MRRAIRCIQIGVGLALAVSAIGRGTSLQTPVLSSGCQTKAATGSLNAHRPIGDYIGAVYFSGHREAAWVTDVLALFTRPGHELFAWLYIDQYGIRWIQLRFVPPNLRSQDVAGAKLAVGASVSPVNGTLNAKVIELKRCDTL